MRTFLNDDTCWNFSVAQRSVVNQCSISSYKRQIGSGTSARMVDEPSGFLIQDLGRWGTTKEADNNTSAALSAVIGASVPIRTKFYDGRVHISDVRNSRYQPLLKVSGNDRTPDGGQTSGRVREELNYMIYYIACSQPTDMMQGNKTYDESHGIFHYLLGRDKGIIKNIKLEKTNTPGLSEVRFEQTGFDGLKQLLVQYDVKIETYLNIKTFPGCYIFVDPRGFDPTSNLIPCNENNFTEYGIGGYYIIISSEHNISDKGGKTTIVAKWVNKIGSDDEDPSASCLGTQIQPVDSVDTGEERNSCANSRALRAEETGGLGGTRDDSISISSNMGFEYFS